MAQKFGKNQAAASFWHQKQVRVNNIRVDWNAGQRLELTQIGYDLLDQFSPSRAVEVMSFLKEEWVKLVQRTTWQNPIPASRNSIIAGIRSGGDGQVVLEFGWFAYKGSLGAAQRRLEMRVEGARGTKGFRSMIEEVLSSWGT